MRRFKFTSMFVVLLSLMINNAVIAKDQKYLDQEIDLLNSNNGSERQRAVLDLFNTLDPKALDSIAQALGDPDPYVRYAAAWALNPRLTEFIDRPEGNYVRGVFPLTLMQSTKIIMALLDAFPEEDPWARREMLATLREHQQYQLMQGVQLNRKIKQVFLDHMKDLDPNIRDQAASGLIKWRDPEAEEAFRQALTDEAWNVRKTAVSYFEKDIQVLTEAIRDSYFMVRAAAIEALYHNHKNNPVTIDLLIARLSDTNIHVRIAARSALGELKEKRVLKPLLVLRDKYKNDSIDTFVESFTGKSIEEVKAEYRDEIKNFQLDAAPIKKQDIQHQIQNFKNGNRFERITSMLYLDWLPVSEQIEVLQQGIQDSDPLVKYSYTEKLQVYLENMIIPAEQIEPVYKNLLKEAKDLNPHVRRVAIKMLALLIRYDDYQTHAIAFVKKTIELEQDPFLKHASIALIDENQTSTMETGLIFLKLMNDKFSEIRKKAVLSISLRCHPEAISSMLKALKDPYSEIRGHAARELGLSEVIPASDYSKVQHALRITSENDPSQTIRKWASQSLDSNQHYLKTNKPVPRSSKRCGNKSVSLS